VKQAIEEGGGIIMILEGVHHLYYLV